ncbi:hypothetical protein MYSTI_04381 [Myxococcus stipitatus DSM 14675]|uniref:Uncharacterized protein n=1 Tax=Myxococcus stipitatus (strain DSM 14675 / JCM 12634 / Mx s8) TaxID=1278073 RepID=L7UDI8_MYXSD|nr:hypothetical protein [Myxococcus stipitatus]AGC45677.1 hypothetical protein MYSTI_04381 [Myxococcus stipitatus DSM 14675]
MSTTTADIVDGITRLVVAVDNLLKTDTVNAIVTLVRQFGIGAPVKVGIDALGKALDLIISWIAKLEQVAAIPSLLESLDPALDGLKAIGDKSEDEMREMGLEPLAPLAGAAHAASVVLEKIRAGAVAILQGYLPQQSLESLRESVVQVKETLKKLGEALVSGASLTGGSSLSLTAGTPA